MSRARRSPRTDRLAILLLVILTAAVLAINPRYGEVSRLAADQASHNYRYIEAAEFARRAVTTDPESPRAYASLGMQLLRTGDEAQARTALERAFRDTRVGADVVKGTIPTLGSKELEAKVPDWPVYPVPYLSLWWKL